LTYLDLFTSASSTFGGSLRALRDSDYVVVGVPFDSTSTYRPGARFAPLAIREASLNIELYSFRTGISFEDLKVHDAGDLHVTGNVEENLRRLSLVTGEVLEQNRIPVFIGGEHTLTLGVAEGIKRDFGLVCFDAHLDMRDEYSSQRVCHATVMRRINEKVKPSTIVQLGTRAASKEEVKYAEKVEVTYITSYQIMREGVEEAAELVNRALMNCKHIYVTVDLDVLDPSFAPAVQNPEPEGLATHSLLEILHRVCGSRVVGFDLVEVAPNYDSGTTAIQAAKIIFEIMSFIRRGR
jgi:agmatinase